MPTLIGLQRVTAGNKRLPSPPAPSCAEGSLHAEQAVAWYLRAAYREIPIRGGWLTCCTL